MSVTFISKPASFSLLAAFCLAGPLVAQPSHPTKDEEKARRVPVTIAIVDSFKFRDARAVVVRQSKGNTRDMIILPRANATGEQLSAAMVTLLADREMSGDSASTDRTLRVNAASGPRAWVGRETTQNQLFVERLLSRQPHNIPGLGVAESDQLYLLPHALKGKVRRAP